MSEAREQLEARLRSEGSLLAGQLVGATQFVNHRVDVELLDRCAAALARMLRPYRPAVILTAEASGIVPAAFVARHLDVAMIYARKDVPFTIGGHTYSANARSQTFRTDITLHLSAAVLPAKTPVVIVDDFLSTGSTINALLELCTESGAVPVAIGVLINKEFLGGRAALASRGLPIHALTTILTWSPDALIFATRGGE